MVTAVATEGTAEGQSSDKVKAPTPKVGFRNQTLFRSQPINVLDFDILPAPTSPLPTPTLSSPPSSSPSPSSSSSSLRTPLRKASQDKVASSAAPASASLRPPPRPRSVVCHLVLGNPPSESLPPVPVILHSSDSSQGPSTPTSPISPTTPSFYSSFSPPGDNALSLSRSLPSSAFRSFSVGRVPSSNRNRPRRKTSQASDVANECPIMMAKDRTLVCPDSMGPLQAQPNLMSNMEEPASRSVTPRPVEAEAEASDDQQQRYAVEEMPLPRPPGLIATRFYGIESSMRWREGVDPIQKRFSSSNGSWRCQDRFAVFFRPGDQIGPDHVVTKTFWSEAWPYPIETILYGTTGPILPSEESTEATQGHHYYHHYHGQSGHRSDHEGDRQISRGRTAAGARSSGSETHGFLKAAASFPPVARSRDPRYITSEGVQKIAKVVIPMPDVAIDQMELVKAPIKVELRIVVLEQPLRVQATASLFGRTVTGTTELYMSA
ncbi:unnamed protein product [Mortierella alpina]